MAGPTVISDDPGPERASTYGWTVFALSFGLLMSDHMARQVLNAAGPQIKAEWHLNNAELASLASVVALAVGLLTLPLSYLADRFGHAEQALRNVGAGLASLQPAQEFVERSPIRIGIAKIDDLKCAKKG